jgi:cytochrome b subunit of formate dehydrogenase
MNKLLRHRLFALVLCLIAFGAARAADPQALTNEGCLNCHSATKKIEIALADGKSRKLAGVDHVGFGAGVHARMKCVACHTNVVDNDSPHQLTGPSKVDCLGCHEALWNEARAAGQAEQQPWLGRVGKNIDAYRNSFHARKNKDDPTKVNATCAQCHDTHTFKVPADRKTRAYAEWRREVPALCGKCHDEQLDSYKTSVHGQEIAKKTDGKGAVCIDCHTTHEITATSLASFKLLVPDQCGSCHKENLASYRDTYHGQRSQLGDVAAAKCYDCHGSHEIKKVADKESKVHPDNKLETCQQCHNGKKLPMATAGFASFHPHANGSDFKKYPQVWVAQKFMVGLLIAVFAFFWTHCLLWYYREWKDRKEGVARAFVDTAGLGLDDHKVHIQRFALGWRIGHLCFALVTMTLVLTGMTALYSETGWARVVAKAFGGANNLGIVHRVCAALFVSIFVVHFVYVMYKLLIRDRKSFRWFGPDSLVPNWKDLDDVIGMFKWFFGRGPRPQFERWAYFEKFDYWAVFWGVNIIGWSGLMLALPHITAKYLPGWVFNVGTLVHGEEAFLAAVFLFTVHFFNNHFRPDKLPPPDIVMFTGSLSLEEFKRDHPAQYNRLVQTGELEKYIVEGPSGPMRVGSKLLGLTLIGIGFSLLGIVAIGFFAGH